MKVDHGGCLKEGIIDFSSNINPLGVSSEVIEIIKANLHKINFYPDPESKKLKTAISRFYDINSENIIIGNGANELIYSIVFALAPHKAILITPTFSEYEKALSNIKCEISYFKLSEKDDFFLDLSKLNENIKNVDMIFLCNPNNPIGNIISKDKLLKFIYKAQLQKKFVVVDESFIDFVEYQSVIKQTQGILNMGLIVIRSFTKYFGLAGLRLGFAAGNKLVIKRIRQARQYWPVNCFAQLAGTAVLKDKEYIHNTQAIIEQEKEFLLSQLNKFESLEAFPTVTNFILMRLKNKMTSAELKNRLIKQGVLIRDCSNFYGLDNKFIRVAIKKRDDNIKLVSALKQILP